MAAVGSHLRLTPVTLGQTIARSIANSPIVWGNLALQLKSALLMREAVIHTVGNWNMLKQEEKKQMEAPFQLLVHKKAEEMERIKQALEDGMAQHYPSYFEIPSKIPLPGAAIPIVRTKVYGGDVLAWMVLCMFRGRFSTMASNKQTQHAEDGGYSFYRCIADAQDTYMPRTTILYFLQKFPLSHKGRFLFTTEICRLKEELKPPVISILENKSMLDTHTYPVKYLTSITVMADDMPSVKDDSPVNPTAPRASDDQSLAADSSWR